MNADAKSFVEFQKQAIIKQTKVYDENLLTSAYSDITENKKAAGIRTGLVGVLNSLDGLLKEFYDHGGNSEPQNVDIQNIKSIKSKAGVN